MARAITAAEMRDIEQLAIDSGVVTGLELMERAGVAVVDTIEALPNRLNQRRRAAPKPLGYTGSDEDDFRVVAVVLCGPGNNGGDGYVIARLLAGKGWDVRVYHYGDPGRLPFDARVNYERWCAIGMVHPIEDLCGGFGDDRIDFIVDAVFGIGLTRDLEPEVQEPFVDIQEWLISHYASPCYIIAVDIPSGICADTGLALGSVLTSDLTVTFHCAKVGHYVQDGPAVCGKVVVKDIGL